MDEIVRLKEAYRNKRGEILGRLSDFRRLKAAPQARLFEELCFCLLTPGAKAENCKKILASLKSEKLLFKGHREQLWPFLKFARFYDQKACRLVAARKHFSFCAGQPSFKQRVFGDTPQNARQWLVRHVKGLGYKEASHFLRNIGRGEDLAILDRHILRRLKGCGVIKELPRTLTPKRYREIEQKCLDFSKRIKIPLEHMDLLFFSQATGKPIKECK